MSLKFNEFSFGAFTTFGSDKYFLSKKRKRNKLRLFFYFENCAEFEFYRNFIAIKLMH